jgi:hypothetical protein
VSRQLKMIDPVQVVAGSALGTALVRGHDAFSAGTTLGPRSCRPTSCRAQ